jgi:hypothetical protein
MALAFDLISRLRRVLKDERVGRIAFRLACVDRSASDCLLGVSEGGQLTTQPINARTARSLAVDLHDPSYGTVRRLYDYLAAQPGYQVVAELGMLDEFPSSGLRVVGSLSCLHDAVPLKHHIFSDDELEEILDDACRRHNVSYTASTVPDPESPFVLVLAHADALRRLASDAARRRGLEFTPDQLLDLAFNLERQYRDDTSRQRRALPVAKPLDSADPGQGEIVISQSFRRRHRHGLMSPTAAAQPPTVPVLREPSGLDAEDVKVTVRWTRNKDVGFYAYELWRDTRPNIERPHAVHSITDPAQLLRQSVRRPSTARLCMRSVGPNTINDRAHAAGLMFLSEDAGQIVTEFVDVGYSSDAANEFGPDSAPPLEPLTTYYYRLFVISANNEVVGSNEIVVTTLTMRALLATTSPLSVTSGPAGTAVTITGSGFHAGMTVTLGGKPVGSLVVASATSASFTVPAFVNSQALNISHDLVVTSETGLVDVMANAFRLTA